MNLTTPDASHNKAILATIVAASCTSFAAAQTVIPASDADAFIPSPSNNSAFGESVLVIPDVDGDGSNDIAVGAPAYDAEDEFGNPINNAGAYFLFSGATGDLIRRVDGFVRDGFIGVSIISIPDRDGDGIADIACGGPGMPFGPDEDTGGVVFFSTATGLPIGGIPGTLGAMTSLGISLADLGDLTGDGVNDFVAGANGLGTGDGSPGYAVVYDGATDEILRVLVGEEAYSIFGTSVGCAGDVNGDGTPDVIVGAPLQDMDNPKGPGVLSDAGRAYVFSGTDFSLLYSVDRFVDDTATQYSNFGTSVGCAGDLNGDGKDDVLVGAPQSQQGSGGNGSVSVFSGNDGSVLFDIEGTFATGEQHGVEVLGISDLNGDGIPEFAGSSSQECFGFCTSRQGQVIIYDGATSTRLFEYNGEQNGDVFGANMDHGDVNNDGAPDLVVTALFHNSGPDGPGEVYIFHGDPGNQTIGDLTGDGVVDVEDLLLLLSGWGTDGPGSELAEPFDVIDVSDLLALLANWS